MSDPQQAPAHSGKPQDSSGTQDGYEQRHAYVQAFADASAAAAQLGVALAHFDNMVNNLAALTPKCECGWAQGHRPPHRKGRRPL